MAARPGSIPGCPAVFRRYNITTEADLGSAAERVTGYVESLPSTRKVTALPEANGYNSVPEVADRRVRRVST